MSKLPTPGSQRVFDALLDYQRVEGRSNVDMAIRTFLRMRIDPGREKRKRFSFPRDYKTPYQRQRGICPICKLPMPYVREALAMDHIDPHAADFNGKANLRVTHDGCNSEKSSDNVLQHSRRSGRMMDEFSGIEPEAPPPDDQEAP